MNLNIVNNSLRSLKIGVSVLALSIFALTAQAQQEEHKNVNVRLGQKALLEGDFKSAVTHLEKALPAESKDPNVLHLLGYSQFQSGLFAKSAQTFAQVVALNPKDANAFYYKAKANNTVAVDVNSKLTVAQKVSLLESAIADYTQAIAINKNDSKLYQNRGVAYRDLGILRGEEGVAYNKTSATNSFNNAITDFEKVLTYDNARKDIQTEVKKAKVYRDLLK